MNKETFHFIKRPWINANGTMYLGIPSKIIDKLNLNQNSYLMIDLIDDYIIMIKKHNPQFTKPEINKVIGNQNNTEKKSIVIEEESEEEFKNPLDDLDI